MKRRDVIALISCSAIGWPFRAEAEPAAKPTGLAISSSALWLQTRKNRSLGRPCASSAMSKAAISPSSVDVHRGEGIAFPRLHPRSSPGGPT